MANDSIKITLSPAGQEQVRAAFKSVERDAARSSKAAAGGIGGINKSLGGLRKVALGVASAFASIQLGRAVRGAVDFADAIGKSADRVGVGVESLQELRFAAERAGLETGTLENGLRQLTTRIGEAAAGNKTAAQAFANLGIAIRNQDGSIRATEAVYKDLMDAIRAIEDPAARLAALRKIDRGLVDHVGFLQQGSGAYDQLAERARELGLVLDERVVRGAEKANDQFSTLQQVLRVNFTRAVLDNQDAIISLTDSLIDFATAVGQAIEGWKLWRSTQTGDVSGLRNIDAIGGRIQKLVAANQELRAEMAIGDFALAFTGRNTDQIRAEIDRNLAEIDRLQRRAKALQIERQEGPKPAAPAAPGEIDDPAARAAAERAAREAEKAAREAERAAAEEARRQEALARQRFGFEQAFLELEGRGREARMRALDQELMGYELLLLAMGESADVIEQRLGRFRELTVVRLDFDEAIRDGQLALEELDRIRSRIRQDVDAGLLSEFQAEKQIIGIEQERLILLQEIATAALASAQALGDPAAIAAAEGLNQQIRQLSIGVNQVAKDAAALESGFEDSFRGSLQGVLSEIGRDITSVSGAVTAFASNFARQMQNIAAEILARRATFALLNFLGGSFTGIGKSAPVKAATGGHIRGPGTSTSDSIPAYLSDGEYVVRAKVVEQPGMLEFLQFVNSGGIRKQPRFSGGIPKFNQGGLATAGEFGRRRGGASGAGGSPVSVTIVAKDPERFRESEGQVAAATANAMAQAANRNN